MGIRHDSLFGSAIDQERSGSVTTSFRTTGVFCYSGSQEENGKALVRKIRTEKGRLSTPRHSNINGGNAGCRQQLQIYREIYESMLSSKDAHSSSGTSSPLVALQ